MKTIIKIDKRKDISRMFYEKTKIKNYSKEEAPIKNWPASWKKIFTKDYPRLESIRLPQEVSLLKMPISTVFLKRKSKRIFSGKGLTLVDLGMLLFYSSGIIPGTKEWNSSRRFYPSAGARYPLELYLSTNKVEGLENGLYHYNVKKHSLDVLWQKRFLNKTISRLVNQDWVEKSNVIFFITSVFMRNQVKYNERGLRHIFLEAGHLAQNVYLIGTSLNLKVCAIGGFMDDKINKILDVDSEDEGVIYILAIGV